MRRVGLLLLLILSACGAQPTPPPVNVTPLASPAAPSASAMPSVTPTAMPSVTPTATATPTATPTITPTPIPQARQLTESGCCVGLSWSLDGTLIQFIDKPSADARVGVWGVPAMGGAPVFVTDTLASWSPDRQYYAYPQGGQAWIVRVADGARWAAPTSGSQPAFSPPDADGRVRIAWQVNSSSANFDLRTTALWQANADGTQAERVATLTGGGFSGWFPTGDRWLITGRDVAGGPQYLAVLDLATGVLTRLTQAARIRSTGIAPDGAWVLYQVSFAPTAGENGLWAVRADGTDAHRLPFGAYRWRGAGHLVLIPFEPDALVQRFVDVDVASGAQVPLTDPALTPIRIAAGNWALSPDGRQVAYVAVEDHAIWVVAFDSN